MFSCWRRNNEAFSQALFVLLLGQVVSFTVAVMSFTSSLLSNLGVYMPLTLSFFTYLSVSLVYGSIFLVRRQKLMVSWCWYLLLGFIDVQGNYLVNKAYQFSSITSVTILDCWTIAWAMILTWIFIGTRYSLSQFLGAAFCVMGLGLVLLSDAGVGGGGGTKPLLGDTLVIVGTLFFAMSNVSEEFCVKNKDRIEVVSMVALFGLIVSVCQIFLLERKSLESVKWSAEIIFCLLGYALASFTLYSLIPFVLKMSGSTMYSLSILTSDMWAVVIRIFFYHQQVDWLYYLSFAIVVLGLIIYSKSLSETVRRNLLQKQLMRMETSVYRTNCLMKKSAASRSSNEALAWLCDGKGRPVLHYMLECLYADIAMICSNFSSDDNDLLLVVNSRVKGSL